MIPCDAKRSNDGVGIPMLEYILSADHFIWSAMMNSMLGSLGLGFNLHLVIGNAKFHSDDLHESNRCAIDDSVRRFVNVDLYQYDGRQCRGSHGRRDRKGLDGM